MSGKKGHLGGQAVNGRLDDLEERFNYLELRLADITPSDSRRILDHMTGLEKLCRDNSNKMLVNLATWEKRIDGVFKDAHESAGQAITHIYEHRNDAMQTINKAKEDLECLEAHMTMIESSLSKQAESVFKARDEVSNKITEFGEVAQLTATLAEQARARMNEFNTKMSEFNIHTSLSQGNPWITPGKAMDHPRESMEPSFPPPFLPLYIPSRSQGVDDVKTALAVGDLDCAADWEWQQRQLLKRAASERPSRQLFREAQTMARVRASSLDRQPARPRSCGFQPLGVLKSAGSQD